MSDAALMYRSSRILDPLHSASSSQDFGDMEGFPSSGGGSPWPLRLEICCVAPYTTLLGGSGDLATTYDWAYEPIYNELVLWWVPPQLEVRL